MHLDNVGKNVVGISAALALLVGVVTWKKGENISMAIATFQQRGEVAQILRAGGGNMINGLSKVAKKYGTVPPSTPQYTLFDLRNILIDIKNDSRFREFLQLEGLSDEEMVFIDQLIEINGEIDDGAKIFRKMFSASIAGIIILLGCLYEMFRKKNSFDYKKGTKENPWTFEDMAKRCYEEWGIICENIKFDHITGKMQNFDDLLDKPLLKTEGWAFVLRYFISYERGEYQKYLQELRNTGGDFPESEKIRKAYYADKERLEDLELDDDEDVFVSQFGLHALLVKRLEKFEENYLEMVGIERRLNDAERNVFEKICQARYRALEEFTSQISQNG